MKILRQTVHFVCSAEWTIIVKTSETMGRDLLKTASEHNMYCFHFLFITLTLRSLNFNTHTNISKIQKHRGAPPNSIQLYSNCNEVEQICKFCSVNLLGGLQKKLQNKIT